MSFYVDIQHASDTPCPFSDDCLNSWVKQTLNHEGIDAELTLRIVNSDEIKKLNNDYRKLNKVTNVLAFPIDYPEEIDLDINLLGDVIICPEVLENESKELKITIEAHWAHIVIHGVLHLLGYDHVNDEDAAIMQPIEIKILAELGFDNPYTLEE